MVALASSAKLACGSSSSQEDACASAAPDGKCSKDGTTCLLDVTCRSGPAEISLECQYGYWRHKGTPCTHAGDECSPRYYCGAGTWVFFGGGGNPPAPCPESLPSDGTPCQPGAGFGADPDVCGYRCDDGAGWVTATCSWNDGTGGIATAGWKPGACTPDG